MPAARDPLRPLDAVFVGKSTIVPDAHRPVAAIIDEDSMVNWVVWPDAPLPDRSIGEVRLWTTPTGAWVVYETDDSDEPRNVVERLAVHLTPGGVTAACSIGEGRPVGVDPDGLWVGDPRDASLWMEDPDSFGGPEPGPPRSTPATDLLRLGTDGSRSVVRVDHLVHRVDVTGTALTLQYYPTGPRPIRHADGSGWNYSYEPRQVVIDITDGLPRSIHTDLLWSQPAVPVDEEAWDREEERRRSAVGAWQGRLDLDGVDGAAWPLAQLDDAERTRAISALRSQFEDLANPNMVWRAGQNSTREEPSDYSDVTISEEGIWPTTEIVVSFTHRLIKKLRLRRRYRVFDDAGYPRSWLYVTIHLDEDLYTENIPPRTSAVDGVLEL